VIHKLLSTSGLKLAHDILPAPFYDVSSVLATLSDCSPNFSMKVNISVNKLVNVDLLLIFFIFWIFFFFFFAFLSRLFVSLSFNNQSLRSVHDILGFSKRNFSGRNIRYVIKNSWGMTCLLLFCHVESLCIFLFDPLSLFGLFWFKKLDWVWHYFNITRGNNIKWLWLLEFCIMFVITWLIFDYIKRVLNTSSRV